MVDPMKPVDASDVLGSQQVAGLWIQPRNSAKQMVGRVAGSVVGGMAGSVAGSAATGEFKGAPEGTPNFGKVAFLALSGDELALIGVQKGIHLRPKLADDAVARVSKTAVAGAELGDGKLASPLTISFTNGVTWDFEIPRARRAAGETFVAAIGA